MRPPTVFETVGGFVFTNFFFYPTFSFSRSLYIQNGKKGAQFDAFEIKLRYNIKEKIIMKNLSIKIASVALAAMLSASLMTSPSEGSSTVKTNK